MPPDHSCAAMCPAGYLCSRDKTEVHMATARESASSPEPKRTLGLTGVTINAMALIAPGAFLWITFQLQAAQSGPDGTTTGFDMWQGIFFALIIAFLTALSYS